MSGLAVGTFVRMSDGSEKPIDEILPGDWILGSDLLGNRFPVEVLDTINKGIKDCHLSVFCKTGQALKDGVRLISIFDQKLLSIELGCSPSKPCIVLSLEKLDFFLCALVADKDSSELWPACNLMQQEIGPGLIFDLKVDHKDGLFVLANGLVVSSGS